MVRARLYSDNKLLTHRTMEPSIATFIITDVYNIPTKNCMSMFWADIMNLVHNKPQTEDEKIHPDIKLSYK